MNVKHTCLVDVTVQVYFSTISTISTPLFMKHSFTRSKTLLRFFILMLSVFPFSQLCAGQAGCFLRRIFIASRWHPLRASSPHSAARSTAPARWANAPASTVGPHRLHRDPSATLRQTHPPPTTPELFATFLPPPTSDPAAAANLGTAGQNLAGALALKA